MTTPAAGSSAATIRSTYAGSTSLSSLSSTSASPCARRAARLTAREYPRFEEAGSTEAPSSAAAALSSSAAPVPLSTMIVSKFPFASAREASSLAARAGVTVGTITVADRLRTLRSPG